MKILFLSSYVDPGSGASILIRLANRLKEEGHEVKILTTSRGYDSDIVEAVRLPAGLEFINRIINKITPNYFSFIYSPLLAAIRNYNPDVINVHWTHGLTIPIKIIPELCQHWPVFWTIHDMWPITKNTFFEYTGGKILLNQDTTVIQKLKRQLKSTIRFMPEALYKYKVRTLNKVNIHTISPSSWLQEKVNASPVFRSATNHHIPNGIDINVFKPLDQNKLRKKYGIPEKRKVILFLSSNLADKRKGFYYFSSALNRLKTINPDLIDNVTTLLIGDNSKGANQYLPTDVKNLGSTKDVSRLVEYYNIADLFISASIADNFPSTLLESMACGTPVVAFDVGGVSEIVINNKTGLLADSKDERDLAENIQKLLTSNSLHNKMGVECRTYAAGNVSMEKFVNNYLELFRRTLVEQRAYPERTTSSR
jgi:glycosyltransferase involved in cell wall biosynthesis